MRLWQWLQSRSVRRPTCTPLQGRTCSECKSSLRKSQHSIMFSRSNSMQPACRPPMIAWLHGCPMRLNIIKQQYEGACWTHLTAAAAAHEPH